MIRSDIHMHSYFSGDSKAPTEDMVKAAIDKGLSFLCFTEHMDYDFPYGKCEGIEDGMFDLNTDAYLYELLGLREKYEGKIEIGFGVEIGMQDSCLDKNKKLVNDFDFDLVIASNHVCDGLDCYYSEFWEGHEVNDRIRQYFEDELRFVNAYDDYDVYGHLDYVTRYIPAGFSDGPYKYDDFKDVIDEILKAIIKNGKGIEINTSGLRPNRAFPMTNPTPEIVKRYKELGGKIITVGADAHAPEYIAYEFGRAEEILKQAGFEGHYIFKKRNPVFCAFDQVKF